MLRDVDETLPERIARLLTDEDPKDIYGAIVSSQFDADRLDYIQRDRLMAGVEFGHIDLDWLFDCLEVGTIVVGDGNPFEAPCLYLGPKGLQVAEEYLEARFRLYQMVYMHKTARGADKMLEAFFAAVMSDCAGKRPLRREPVLHFLTSERPSLGSYLALDDAAVWAALSSWIDAGASRRVSGLARRLRDRELYKCVDIGVLDRQGGDLFGRFRRALDGSRLGMARRGAVRRHRRRALQVVRLRRCVRAEQGAGQDARRRRSDGHRQRLGRREGAEAGEAASSAPTCPGPTRPRRWSGS